MLVGSKLIHLCAYKLTHNQCIYSLYDEVSVAEEYLYESRMEVRCASWEIRRRTQLNQRCGNLEKLLSHILGVIAAGRCNERFSAIATQRFVQNTRGLRKFIQESIMIPFGFLSLIKNLCNQKGESVWRDKIRLFLCSIVVYILMLWGSLGYCHVTYRVLEFSGFRSRIEALKQCH